MHPMIALEKEFRELMLEFSKRRLIEHPESILTSIILKRCTVLSELIQEIYWSERSTDYAIPGDD